jgi:hypothetical protein
MNARAAEAHVERLIGRQVHDSAGARMGRIHEMLVEIVGEEHVVTEFHLGGGARFERIAAFVVELPFLSRLPFARHQYRVSWRDLDLSNPDQPRARRPRASFELDRRRPAPIER